MKKLISVLLCISLLFGFTVSCFADVKNCDCGFSPIIYVGPLGCTSIVRDAKTDKAQTLWKTDTNYLLAELNNVLPDINKALITNDTALLGDALIAFVKGSFGDLQLDENGNSKSNVTTPELNIPTGSKHGIDCDYYFDYDFRLDPFEHAERLHEFIEQVKVLTGHDSVKLKCSSMGGVVLSAYLEKYGHEGIDVIICRCCPLWGTAVAGEAFTGKLELNATALARYGEDAIPFLETGFADSIAEGMLYSLLQTLKTAGIPDAICLLGDKLIEDLGERLYNEALIPIFGSMPGIWSFVPQDYFDEAVTFMNIPANSGLHDKIYAYRNAMNHIVDNLASAKADGVEICLICGYNVQRTPLVSLWRSTSDGTVDTKYASLGATCGEVKQTLSDDYISQITDFTYLSSDRMIDASTCAFPDNTWFVKDWLHCNGNKGIDELFNRVMTGNQVSVHSFEAFPQFLVADDDADTVFPLTQNDNAAQRFKLNPTFFNFVRMFYVYVEAVFTKIKATLGGCFFCANGSL